MSENRLFHSGEENESDPESIHANPDHHQKSITSRVSPLARACQVWLKSVSAFVNVSYPVYRQSVDWQAEHL